MSKVAAFLPFSRQPSELQERNLGLPPLWATVYAIQESMIVKSDKLLQYSQISEILNLNILILLFLIEKVVSSTIMPSLCFTHLHIYTTTTFSRKICNILISTAEISVKICNIVKSAAILFSKQSYVPFYGFLIKASNFKKFVQMIM